MTAGEWYVFDGVSQRGPMSHADVVQFLRSFADRNAVSVWRPGLNDWKPASHLFDIAASPRLVAAAKEPSCKRRYSLYGIYAGLSISLADYLFEWRGSKFQPWEGNGLAGNIDYIFGTVATTAVLAFIIGAIVDFGRGRSRRKSVLDPTTFNEPEFLPDIPSDANGRKNFVARYWRGEYSLGVSYWWFGFVGNIAITLITACIVILFRADRGYDPRAIFGSVTCGWLVTVVFIIWQVTGVWRSANRLIAQRRAVGKPSGWATAARLLSSLAS